MKRIKSISICCIVLFTVVVAGGVASLGQDDNDSNASSTESDSSPNPDPDGVMQKTPEDLTPADLEAARKLQKLIDAETADAKKRAERAEAANQPSGSGGDNLVFLTIIIVGPFAGIYYLWLKHKERTELSGSISFADMNRLLDALKQGTESESDKKLLKRYMDNKIKLK